MAHITRRQLLRRGGQAGFALGTPALWAGCGAAPPFIPLDSDAPTEQTARVSVVRGTNLSVMTRECLEAVGGIGSFIHQGETVFIKGNFGGLGFVPHNLFTSGECTKVEIVATVAEECLRAGAAEVIIGEGGQVPSFDWADAVTLDGSTNLTAEAQRLRASYSGKVTLACLETDSPGWDPVQSLHTGLGNIFVSGLLARADRVISIAPLKTHRWSYITGCMKNFVGTTPQWRYATIPNSRAALHFANGGVDQCFVDIVAGLKPVLGIIDGSIGCEGNGPHVFPMWGTTVDIRDRLGEWFLLASPDLAAVDATAARIIGLNVDQIPGLQRAYAQGFGQIQENMIELAGANLENLRMTWQPAEHTEGFGEVMGSTILLRLLGLW